MSDSLKPHELHYIRLSPSLSLTISQSLPKLMSNESVMPSNHLILFHLLLLLSSIFPSIRAFSNESDLPIRWLKIGASTSASVLPMSIQGWFPLGLIHLISWQYKGLSSSFQKKKKKKSSPAPQCKSINSSGFSLLYGPTFTSIHDYWEKYIFDSTDLCLIHIQLSV